MMTAQQDLSTVLQAFKYLNVPVATEKIAGPSSKITYLGINIDSSNMTISKSALTCDDPMYRVSTVVTIQRFPGSSVEFSSSSSQEAFLRCHMIHVV